MSGMAIAERHTLAFGMVGWLLVGYVLAEMSGPQSVGNIDSTVELLPPIKSGATRFVTDYTGEMQVWPSEAGMKASKLWTNRADVLVDERGKPVWGKRVAVTDATNACREAAMWLKEILEEKWLPSDLDNRLIALQRNPASRSLVICRYEIAGNAIQVNQSRSYMWVTIQPSTNITKGVSVPELGSVVFRTFFARGEKMARIAHKEVKQQDGVRVFERTRDIDVITTLGPNALSVWWGWETWYTDGKTVGVLLWKKGENSASVYGPETPWF